MKMRPARFIPLIMVLLGSATAGADPMKFPTFGIALSPPANTSFDLTDSPGCVGLFVFDKDSATPGAAVCVEWVPAHDATADDMAQAMVKDHGATAMPGSYAIGGEKAAKVAAPYGVGAFTNRVTYLVRHGNFIYMISAFNTATADASGAVDAFLPAVSFFDPEPPTKHADELSETAWKVLDSFTMKFPACSRKFDSEPKLLNVGISDLSGASLGQPFSVDIEPVQTPNPVEFAAIRDAYSTNIGKTMGIPADKPLVWHTEEGLPALNYTDVATAPSKAADGSASTSTVRLAILQLSPGNFVQFAFTFSDPVDVYADLSAKMLKTVAVPAAPAGK